MKPLLRALGALLLALAPAGAAADLFSPGPLSKDHADLEGIRSCTRCHEAGEQLSPAKCLSCHGEVKARVERRSGLHGRLAPAERTCEKCHPEHRGRGAALVDWGAGGKKGFDHGRTGWELKGAHRDAPCDDCHQKALIVDAAVKRLLTTGKKQTTLLGLPTQCSSCHFDEHRGQVSEDCASCHTEKAWKPAPGFDHAKTAFALRGEHRKVECVKCHEPRRDERTAADAFPAPKARTFLALEGIAHGSCADCHRDPHAGRFGARCESCHSEDGWGKLNAAATQATAFHEKTRFPLRGAHARVKCASCHGPSPGRKAVFRGLPFAACTDCHFDPHVGQLAPAFGQPPACEKCHDVESFAFARFELGDHASTAYPLEGAHRAVACDRCHTEDPALAKRVPAATAADLKRRGRPVQASTIRFDLPETAKGCAGCHGDPHAGQFAGRTCESCHRIASFSDLAFDHGKDSRFPLEGAHRDVPCGSCHVPERRDGKLVTRFKPLETTCAACHVDPHAGQFEVAGVTDCARCHEAKAFKPAKFDHASFPLIGKHEKVACGGCHGEVEVAPGVRAVRYRPLPTRCEGCHADPHRGAFRELAEEALAALETAERSAAGIAAGALPANVAPGMGRAGLPPGADRGRDPAVARVGLTRCVACHQPAGWTDVSFAHERTGFPLVGRHEDAPCRSCHLDGFERPLPTACGSCHQDPHRGDLGMRCESCHTPETWRSDFNADAHRRTNFPLVGRHAFLPCVECHPDARDRSFSGPAVPCIACHLRDYQRTRGAAIDHVAMGFSTECRECHDPWSFERGIFPGHDDCFQLRGTEHAGIECLDCHRSIPSGAPPGTCSTGTAACSDCHEHKCSEMDHEHRGVPGYQCKDRKCYECHRFSTGGD